MNYEITATMMVGDKDCDFILTSAIQMKSSKVARPPAISILTSRMSDLQNQLLTKLGRSRCRHMALTFVQMRTSTCLDLHVNPQKEKKLIFLHLDLTLNCKCLIINHFFYIRYTFPRVLVCQIIAEHTH